MHIKSNHRWMLALLGVSVLFAPGCARVQPPDVPPELQVASRLREALGGEAAAAGASPAAAAAEPTGWATVKGTIRLTDKVGFEPLPVDKDVEVCGMQIVNETVVCGAANELKNALVYVATKLPADAEPWVHGSYADSAAAAVEFDQKNCLFLSHVFAMRSSQKLRILNSDTVGHNTSIAAFGYNRIIPANGSDDSAEPKPTEPADVSCSIHPWMKAYIYTAKNPYFAVTNAKGEFELKNVPAGVELELRFWQEKVKFVPEANINGAAVKLPKGKMKLTLANDEEKKLEIEFDAARFR